MCDICGFYICPSGCPNSPEAVVFTCCESCGGEIYDGDEYYEIDGNVYCSECVHDGRKTAEVE